MLTTDIAASFTRTFLKTRSLLLTAGLLIASSDILAAPIVTVHEGEFPIHHQWLAHEINPATGEMEYLWATHARVGGFFYLELDTAGMVTVELNVPAYQTTLGHSLDPHLFAYEYFDIGGQDIAVELSEPDPGLTFSRWLDPGIYFFKPTPFYIPFGVIQIMLPELVYDPDGWVTSPDAPFTLTITQPEPTSVPEPEMALLLLVGLAGLAGATKRRVSAR